VIGLFLLPAGGKGSKGHNYYDHHTSYNDDDDYDHDHDSGDSDSGGGGDD